MVETRRGTSVPIGWEIALVDGFPQNRWAPRDRDHAASLQWGTTSGSLANGLLLHVVKRKAELDSLLVCLGQLHWVSTTYSLHLHYILYEIPKSSSFRPGELDFHWLIGSRCGTGVGELKCSMLGHALNITAPWQENKCLSIVSVFAFQQHLDSALAFTCSTNPLSCGISSFLQINRMKGRGSMANCYNTGSNSTKLTMAKLHFSLKEEELWCVTFQPWLGIDCGGAVVVRERQFLPQIHLQSGQMTSEIWQVL